MAKKVPVTRTTNPLHFEDLEPHRFEDLVRRLLYTFRDWTNIEATGRGGADEGFDVRAWEKSETITNVGDEGEEGMRELEGNLWQVQGKREKTLTPAQIRNIIAEDVDGARPPYGYILAAATNITKASLDAFRDELKKKGVKEFYFWGKDYLEDQLALPQNDEILFTFFGLSLSPRRRSRMAEVKFSINNKNKIQRILFGSDTVQGNSALHQPFLLRDIKDQYYPDAEMYPDFEAHRRWEEHNAVQLEPRGLFFKVREWYAYVDTEKRTWGFTRAVDMTPRKHNLDTADRERSADSGKKVERYWRHLPLRHQAKFHMFGFVNFDDMLIIDDKGDSEYPDPHIYSDFGEHGPFAYITHNLRRGNEVIDLRAYTKVDAFPNVFPEPVKGAVHKIADLAVSQQISSVLRYSRGPCSIYAFDRCLDIVNENDVIHCPATAQRDSESHTEVTHVRMTTVKELLKEHSSEESYFRTQLAEHAGREIKDDDQVRVLEVHAVMPLFSGDFNFYLDSSV